MKSSCSVVTRSLRSRRVNTGASARASVNAGRNAWCRLVTQPSSLGRAHCPSGNQRTLIASRSSSTSPARKLGTEMTAIVPADTHRSARRPAR
jgi:hypothetical protein